MADIRSRLLAVEADFLSALLEGDTALQVFQDTWSALHDDISTAMQSNGVDEETWSLAYSVSTRIEVLADGVQQIDDTYNSLTSDMVDEVEIILSRLSIEDVSSLPAESTCRTPESLDLVAHAWLVAHLHNPYPSNIDKELIAHRTGVETRAVCNWFKRARKRIGWTSVCQRSFGGSLAEMVDAATRAYAEDNKTSPPPRFTAEFLDIRRKAMELCLMPAAAVQSAVTVRKSSRKGSLEKHADLDSSMNCFSLWETSSLENLIPAEVAQGCTRCDVSSRKRRLSLSWDEEPVQPDEQPRKSKRLCTGLASCWLTECMPMSGFTSRNLPSAAAEPVITSSIAPPLQSIANDLGASEQASSTALTHREYSMTGANVQLTSERPPTPKEDILTNRDASPSPALEFMEQTRGIDDWFTSTFHFPEEAVIAAPDPFIPLDIEIYKGWSLQVSPCCSGDQYGHYDEAVHMSEMPANDARNMDYMDPDLWKFSAPALSHFNAEPSRSKDKGVSLSDKSSRKSRSSLSDSPMCCLLEDPPFEDPPFILQQPSLKADTYDVLSLCSSSEAIEPDAVTSSHVNLFSDSHELPSSRGALELFAGMLNCKTSMTTAGEDVSCLTWNELSTSIGRDTKSADLFGGADWMNGRYALCDELSNDKLPDGRYRSVTPYCSAPETIKSPEFSPDEVSVFEWVGHSYELSNFACLPTESLTVDFDGSGLDAPTCCPELDGWLGRLGAFFATSFDL